MHDFDAILVPVVGAPSIVRLSQSPDHTVPAQIYKVLAYQCPPGNFYYDWNVASERVGLDAFRGVLDCARTVVEDEDHDTHVYQFVYFLGNDNLSPLITQNIVELPKNQHCDAFYGPVVIAYATYEAESDVKVYQDAPPTTNVYDLLENSRSKVMERYRAAGLYTI